MIVIKNYKTDPIEKCDIQVCRGYPLGNPYGFIPSRAVKYLVGSRREAIESFATYLERMISERNPIICDELNRILTKYLRGEDFGLVCACRPLACHANVIKSWVEKQTELIDLS